MTYKRSMIKRALTTGAVLGLLVVSSSTAFVGFAKEEFQDVIIQDKEIYNVESKEEIVLSLNNSQLGGYEDVSVVYGQLEYDRTVFEEVLYQDIVMNEEYTSLSFNKDTGAFTAKFIGEDTSDEILQVTMTAKPGIQANVTEVSLTDIQILVEDSLVKLSEEVITINTLEDQTEPKLQNQELEESELEKDESKEFRYTVEKRGSTGVRVLVGLIGIIAMGLIFYFCKIYFRWPMARTILGMVVAGLLTLLLVIYLDGNVELDVNNDGVLNQQDEILLSRYLLGDTLYFENIEVEDFEFDVNGDGQIDLYDLGNLTYALDQSVTEGNITVNPSKGTVDKETESFNVEDESEDEDSNELDENIEVDIALNQDVYEKNEAITLSMAFTDLRGYTVKSVMINGEAIEANAANNSLVYHVQVPVFESSGLKDLIVDSFTLSNGTSIKTNHTIKIEVLKDNPSIEQTNLTINDDLSEIEVTVVTQDEDLAMLEWKQ